MTTVERARRGEGRGDPGPVDDGPRGERRGQSLDELEEVGLLDVLLDVLLDADASFFAAAPPASPELLADAPSALFAGVDDFAPEE